jgi:hypothetical protein
MKSIIYSILVVFAITCVTLTALTYSNSAPPTGYSNAPGEVNCTSCHGGSLITSGLLANALTLTSSVPITQINPNQTCTLSLSFTHPTRIKFGFQLVALPSSATGTTASTGTFTALTTETEINTSGNREYASHSGTGTSAPGGNKTWDIEWTAPNTYTGGITFYAIVNAANNNGSSSGDEIIAKTFSATVLPVKWLSFTATAETNQNKLVWRTASETNNHFYTIQQSTDGKSWVNIGTVQGRGTVLQTSTYSFTDVKPFTTTHYRIQQTDFDGRTSLSNTITVNQAAAQATTVFYNANLHVLQGASNTQYTVYNSQGNSVAKWQSETSTINWPSGIYYIVSENKEVHKLFIF